MFGDDSAVRLGTLMNLFLSILTTMLIIAVIGLFAWSHLLQIGFIRNTISLSSVTEYDSDVYKFTIVTWIMNLWDASSEIVAVFILCFSLIWPYIRLIFLLLLLWLPTRTIARHRGLIVLDILGKIAFYDVFVFIIIINMFAQTISQDTISGTITVEPSFGIVVYSCAIVLSIFVTLLVLFFDHYYSKVDVLIRVSTLEMQEDYKPPCCPHWLQLHAPLIISMFNCENGCLFFCQLFLTRIIMLANLVVAFVCIIGAYITNCLRVVYTGSSTTTTDYSIVNFGSAAINNTDITSIQTWLAIIYELLVVVFPILTCLLLMVLWFIPIPHFMYVRIRPTIRAFYTWCSLDVMFVAIITAAYQLPSFYTWLVNNKYTTFCDYLKSYSSQCPSISISVLTGTWFALLGFLSLWIVSTYSIYYTEPSDQSDAYNIVRPEYQSVSQKTDEEDSYQSVDNTHKYSFTGAKV